MESAQQLMTDNNIFFFWKGPIHKPRLKLMQDCVYSTCILNPTAKIFIVSNNLKPDQFHPCFAITILSWDASFFTGLALTPDTIDKYMRQDPRTFSDLFRLVLLYQFGGSYIDTDDIAIKQLPTTRNLICRCYDPHCSMMSKVTPNECLDGKYREIRGYDSINLWTRNDCMINWDKHHPMLYAILSDSAVVSSDTIVKIGKEISWQSLILAHCKSRIATIGTEWNIGLTLLYVFEDFVARSSKWDLGNISGEMIDLWKSIPHDATHKWGEWKVARSDALNFLNTVRQRYPYLSHMWLHSKCDKQEWKLDTLNTNDTYSVSTWIYDDIKTMITSYINLHSI